ncbi:Hpt domain-containing protein, partial [Noviherbaspirillum sp.]|uniref:Hpt domain-containing protein n=1 Tax=Noviherbaspirillum sp. TaxID=1926288 RepID=UPI002FE2924E
MTTPSSAITQGVRDTFDTGPLSWVMGEIREALGRSKAALYEAAAQDAEAQSTTLRHAKSYLHQAHGALQIVDVDGVSIITETVEDLLDRVDTKQLQFNSAMAQAIDHGYLALVEYLEELLSGLPHQPVRLFPYYRALLEVRGAERIHPADLFFPNLAIRPQLPVASAATAKPDYAALRQRFERALLPFLKSTDRTAELANATVLRDVVAEIDRMQSAPQSRAFWWVMHGFAEAVAAGKIPKEIYVKQLFARINLQIRRLSQGSSSIAERLLRDALFFIAQMTDPSPRAVQIRNAYQLDGLVPADYEIKRYGQINLDALAAAKERLSQAKNLWNRIAGGDVSGADTFEHEMHALADAGAKLNAPALTKLLRELSGISRHAARGTAGESLGLEMATSLLFIENALGNIGRLPDNFAERADAMTARLLSIVAGQQPVETAQWLDDMSREAQQRQTMTVLAGEMQNSLRQVEKMLDEYFRDPAQQNALGQLDTILYQIEGAMAILDQDDAMRTIQHTRAAVKRFAAAEADVAPEQQEFQQVAENVGALSFFIETLQHNASSAKQRFSYDEERGVFRASVVEKGPAPEPIVEDPGPFEPVAETDGPAVPGAETVVLSTVEDELELHLQQSAELALSLSAEPGNQELQEQLKESLEQIRRDAALVDNPEANDLAEAGIEALNRADIAASTQVLAPIVSNPAPAVPAAPTASVAPETVTPETDEAVDAELLEIFLMEAEEVLECVGQTVPAARSEPSNQEHLTTLRRSFHTLKGSGRMVGLVAFGEAAWSIEQVLNLRLSDARPGDADLYALLDKAAELLGAWVQDLKTQGRSSRTSHALVAAAERIKSGQSFLFEETASGLQAEPQSDTAPDSASEAESALDLTGAGSNDQPEISDESNAIALDGVPVDVAPATPAAADILPESLTASLIESLVEPEAAQVSSPSPDLPIDDVREFEPAFELATELAPELPADATQEIAAVEALPSFDIAADFMQETALEPVAALPEAEEIELSDADMAMFDSGNSAVGATEETEAPAVADFIATDDIPALTDSGTVEEFPIVLELDAVEEVQAEPVFAASPRASVAEVIDFPTMTPAAPVSNDNVKRIGDLEISVPLHNIYLAETDELVRLLANDIAEWRHEPERRVSIQAVHAAHSLAGSSATVGFNALQEVAHALEMVLQFLMRKAVRLADREYDTLEQSVERLKLMLQTFALGEMPQHEPEFVLLLSRMLREIEARSDTQIEIQPQAPLAVEFDLPEEEHVETAAELPAAAASTIDASTAEPAESAESLLQDNAPEEPVAESEVAFQSVQAQPAVRQEAVFTSPSDDTPHPAIVVNDDLDADLLPVFLEEGRDMLPEMGQVLRSWQGELGSAVWPQSMLRLLHTLKGSARMAGAMALGQHLHDMESRIENIMHLSSPTALSVDDLLVRYDDALQLFEQLQNPSASKPAAQQAPVQGESMSAEVSNPFVKGDEPAEPVVLTSVMPVPSGRFIAPKAPEAAPVPAAAGSASVPLVRVRADILDRLVNQAGEVSIARSKIETEVGTLRQSLSELTENVGRLRDQLREIEMQAESQITSRMAHSADREFDPLEFDRFTRLQELTRMMAESVNDVGSVQQNLSRTLDSATGDLSIQARLTRDLQQDLMRVRMVQFASISERLYRVTRQTAKEMDKRVNLDIRGSAVEIDRGVLEKMTGPFEHLLRNAIVHGIESRASRRSAGKNETGELLVEIRQEGNEVVIQFSDDGQGLNLDNIRKKARQVGLLTDDTK